MLEKNNYRVVGEADNGQVAVQKFKELNPDVVAMDIAMPVMDGIKALKEIKQIAPNSKIVMISALGQEVFVRESALNEAEGFIIKPFKEEQVIKTLKGIESL